MFRSCRGRGMEIGKWGWVEWGRRRRERRGRGGKRREGVKGDERWVFFV